MTSFPPAPDVRLVAELLTAEQITVLQAYNERHAELDAARQAHAAARQAHAAAQEDAGGASTAALDHAGTAPPSVTPARAEAEAQASRYVSALAGLLEDDLLALWRALVPDQLRLVEVANMAVSEDDGKRPSARAAACRSWIGRSGA
jgi:hypothetical protein